MKIVYITPHLSTGGMPEYLRKKVELLHKDNEIWVFEMVYEKQYTSIREKIAGMIGSNLISLDQNYKKLFDLLQKISPDIIHFEETSDYFLPHSLLDKIYSPSRNWKIFETLHDSSIDHREKKYLPDKMLVVSLWQVKNFLPLGIPIEIIEHEIIPGERNRELGMKTLGLDPEKKHVLQVGLFSNRKNQRFTFSLARLMPDVQFHFVGALPDNYRDHWQDLVDNKPQNCVIWKERSDVHNFYSCVDAVIFPSEGKYGDTETNPLAIKEAIAWDIPLFLRNIPVYMNGYQESSKLKWMAQDLEENSKILYSMLNLINNYTIIKPDFFNQKLFDIQFDKSDNKLTINYLHDIPFDMMVCIRDLDTEVPIYSFNARFENKNNYWTIPLPKSYYDFSENPNFSGFLVDFYDPGENLLYSQSYGIKFIDTQKKKFRIDTYEPVFVNFEQFFTDKIYDKFFSQIKDLDLVLDIGSSVGLFTELAKDKGAKKIVAFEVSDRATKIFNNLHGKDSRVELIKMAVWDKKETIKIYEDQDNSIISSAITKTDKYFETPAVDLDSVFRGNRIEKVSLMKMDIEGSEYKAFDGLSDENLLKIENIILEFHDNVGKVLRNKILKRLINLGMGYQIYQEDCDTISDGTTDEKGVVFISKRFLNEDHNIKSESKSTIIFIDNFVSSPETDRSLIEKIKIFKRFGFDILLISKTSVSNKVQENTDFYFYNRNIPMIDDNHKKLIETFIHNSIYLENNLVFTLKNNFYETEKHKFSYLMNFYSASSLGKSLGYKNIVRLQSNDYYGKKSIKWIKESCEYLESSIEKSILFFSNVVGQENYQDTNFFTNLQIWNIDHFFEIFPKIKSKEDYINFIENKFSSENFFTIDNMVCKLISSCKYTDLIIYEFSKLKEILPDSIWNIENSSEFFYDGYVDVFHDVYKKEDDEKILFFSKNLTNDIINIKIFVKFDDGREELIYQELPKYQDSWCWDLLDSNVESWKVYYKDELISEGSVKDLENWVEFPKNNN